MSYDGSLHADIGFSKQITICAMWDIFVISVNICDCVNIKAVSSRDYFHFGKICCYAFLNYSRSIRVCRNKKKNSRHIVSSFNVYLRMYFRFNSVMIFQMFKDIRCFAEKQIVCVQRFYNILLPEDKSSCNSTNAIFR